jgi:hypothetical protein
MESLKYDLKLFLRDPTDVRLEEFIPIFHRWIQTQCLDELLIDVADYRHVHHGPGVMLIAHDAHYAMDMAEGRMGLLYSRRRETHPQRRSIRGGEERLASVFRCTLTACQLLEASLQGRLHFGGDRLLLRINDRLLGPNTPEAYDDLRVDLEPLLMKLYPGCQVEVERVTASETRLTVIIKAPSSPDVGTLLRRLNGSGVGAAS